jgi:hypothetical protein
VVKRSERKARLIDKTEFEALFPLERRIGSTIEKRASSWKAKQRDCRNSEEITKIVGDKLKFHPLQSSVSMTPMLHRDIALETNYRD